MPSRETGRSTHVIQGIRICSVIYQLIVLNPIPPIRREEDAARPLSFPILRPKEGSDELWKFNFQWKSNVYLIHLEQPRVDFAPVGNSRGYRIQLTGVFKKGAIFELVYARNM